MKLLCEFIDMKDIEFIKESAEGGIKKYYLKGPFLEAEVKNKNGRSYMKDTLIREVKKFNDDKILKNRSMGELDHPADPTINLRRVSHVITHLEMDGNIGYGAARLIDTPKGRIAKVLVDEGIILGMSTRGVGTLENQCVKDDYNLITVDIVADPSAPSAFVEGVLENKEYIIGKNGYIVEAIDTLQKNVDKKYNKYEYRDSSKIVLEYMMEFINKIKLNN